LVSELTFKCVPIRPAEQAKRHLVVLEQSCEALAIFPLQQTLTMPLALIEFTYVGALIVLEKQLTFTMRNVILQLSFVFIARF